MAASDAALGRAVLELATDDTKLNAGLTDAKAGAASLGPALAGAGAQASTFGERLGMLGKQAGIAGTASKVLSSALGQFTVAGLATNAITGVVSAIGSLIERGNELPAIQQSFQRLTASVKQSADAMLVNMRAGTKSLVSDLDLMKSANKALLLGLPITSASMGELAKTATTLGKAMGQDATKSLDDLITALGRSSPMILDNLGLTVKVGEANEAYARKLGKTVEQLSDAEKKMAFYEAALEAARVKTEQLGEQTMTLGEIAQSVWVKVGNIVTETASAINVGLGSALSSGKGFADFAADVIKFGPGLALTLANTREEIKALDAARRAAMGKDVNLESFASTLLKVEQAAGKSAAAIIPLNAQQATLALRFAASGKSAAQIAEELNKVQGWNVQAAAVEKVIGAHKKGSEAAAAYAKTIADLAEKLSGGGAVKSADEMVAALARMGPIGKLTKESQIEIAKTMEAAIAVYQAAGKAIPLEYQRIAMAARAASKTVNDSTKETIATMQAAWSKIGGIKLDKIPVAFGFEDPTWATRETLKATRSFVGVVSQVDAVAVGKAASQRMKDAFGPNFWKATFGSPAEFGAGLGSAIQGALQGGGSVVNAAGGFIGGQIGTSIATKLGASLMKEGAGVLSKAMGGLLEAVLPGIGALLGPLLEKAWGGIKKLFGIGGRDGRKLVEEFAKGMGGFDALQQQLLALGPAYDELWRRLTQLKDNASTEEAQAAIDAVTAALEENKKKAGEAADAAAAAAAETAASQAAAIDEIKARYADGFAAIDAEYKKLNDSVAAEAEEAEMGAQERQDRARMAELEAQRAALQAQQDAEIAAKEETFGEVISKAQTVDAALRELFGRKMQIPIEFVRINSPGDAGEVPAVPMAGGGMGRVTRPTLFYSRGDEDYAFSGEGKSFGLAGLASRPIVIEHTTNLDGRVVARNQIRHTPNELARAGVRSR